MYHVLWGGGVLSGGRQLGEPSMLHGAPLAHAELGQPQPTRRGPCYPCPAALVAKPPRGMSANPNVVRAHVCVQVDLEAVYHRYYGRPFPFCLLFL